MCVSFIHLSHIPFSLSLEDGCFPDFPPESVFPGVTKVLKMPTLATPGIVQNQLKPAPPEHPGPVTLKSFAFVLLIKLPLGNFLSQKHTVSHPRAQCQTSLGENIKCGLPHSDHRLRIKSRPPSQVGASWIIFSR